MKLRRFSPVTILLNLLKNYFLTIVVAVGGALLVRAYAFEAFRVPTDFMAPALLPGDHIFVSKIPIGSVKRGDVVVFSFPNDPRKDFMKRVVGIAGDAVEIREGKLFLNGEPISNAGVPAPQSVAITLGGRASVFAERLGKHRYFAQWLDASAQKMIEVKVPPGQVFVLSDNRSKGQDSRAWGFLQEEYIKGRALFVWLSVGSEGIRWSRFFKGTD